MYGNPGHNGCFDRSKNTTVWGYVPCWMTFAVQKFWLFSTTTCFDPSIPCCRGDFFGFHFNVATFHFSSLSCLFSLMAFFYPLLVTRIASKWLGHIAFWAVSHPYLLARQMCLFCCRRSCSPSSRSLVLDSSSLVFLALSILSKML